MKESEQLFVTTFFLLVGIGEFIASVNVLVDSNEHYLGGIYLGALCMVVGLAGYFSPFNHSDFWLGLVFLVMLCACTSSVLQGLAFEDVNGLEACSIYTPNSLSNSCQSTGYYHCYGDQSYFSEAQICASTYKGGTDDDTCVCVKSTDSDSKCWSFKNMDRCDHLLQGLPHSFLASLILAVVIAAVSFGSFMYRIIYVTPFSALMSGSSRSTTVYRKNTHNDNQLSVIAEDEEQNTHQVVFPDTPSAGIVGDRSKPREKPFSNM